MENYPLLQNFPINLRRLITIAVFFTIAPLALVLSVFSLVAISGNQAQEKKIAKNFIVQPKSGVNIYASLPASFPSVSGHIISADSRIELARQFLAKSDSPLTSYAPFIVQTADKYNLDYKLILAIAMKESGLCKAIPEASYNCWGWGIHSKGTLKFDSFEEGIETVTRGLKENYIDLGYVSVEEIMKKYTPLSPGGVWAQGVSAYMSQIK